MHYSGVHTRPPNTTVGKSIALLSPMMKQLSFGRLHKQIVLSLGLPSSVIGAFKELSPTLITSSCQLSSQSPNKTDPHPRFPAQKTEQSSNHQHSVYAALDCLRLTSRSSCTLFTCIWPKNYIAPSPSEMLTSSGQCVQANTIPSSLSFPNDSSPITSSLN